MLFNGSLGLASWMQTADLDSVAQRQTRAGIRHPHHPHMHARHTLTFKIKASCVMQFHGSCVCCMQPAANSEQGNLAGVENLGLLLGVIWM